MISLTTAKEVASLAVVKEIIQRKGGWYYFGERKWQGIDPVIASIREEVDLKEQIQKLVFETSDLPMAEDSDD